MKNFLLLLVTIALFSCSGSDDNSSVSQSALNPPSWAQGTWNSYYEGVNSGTGFKITSNNFCTVLQSGQNCWKELVDSSAGQITIDENISNTDYVITMTGAGSTTTIHLHKVSSTEIEAVSTTGLNITYIKQ